MQGVASDHPMYTLIRGLKSVLRPFGRLHSTKLYRLRREPRGTARRLGGASDPSSGARARRELTRR
eukprot:1194617-Prorocentrum_minimum.AAC.2